MLRGLGADGELALDEIWSLNLARRLSSALQILNGIHLDNNHYLTTLWLYWWRDRPAALLLRAPSVVAGAAAVWVAARIGARNKPPAPLLFAAVFGLSSLLVHYSSEARGYGPLIFFCLAAWHLAGSYLRERSVRAALLFSLSVIGGFLSHLIFVHAFVGLALWLSWRILDEEKSVTAFAKRAAVLFAPALGFLAVLWWLDLRELRFGGGDPGAPLELVWQTQGWLWFGSSRRWACLAGAALSLLACVHACLQWRRASGDREWIFFLTTILLSPAIALALGDLDFLHLRYFLVSDVFLLVLCARLLADCNARSGVRRGAALATLGLFAFGNLRADLRLWKIGRGHYLEALNAICAATPAQEVFVGSGQDFRSMTLIDFYAPAARACGTVRYLPHRDWTAREPRWFLLANGDRDPQPFERRREYGVNFRLRGLYTSVELSGWSWFVYERE